jgi:DNA-binding NtrC family response regulator
MSNFVIYEPATGVIEVVKELDANSESTKEHELTTRAHLPALVCGVGGERRPGGELPTAGLDLRAAVEAFENDLILQALARTGWNKNQAAQLLGLNRTTLVEMLKRKRLNGRAA